MTMISMGKPGVLLLGATVFSLMVSAVLGCAPTEEVTVADLVAAPQQYNGKQVSVEGFYFHGFEIIVLSERLEYSGKAPGHLAPQGGMVWVEGAIPRELYDQLYQQQMMGPSERYGKVRITGKFQYGGKYGHVGAYDSHIVPVEVALLSWSPPPAK